MKVIAFWNVALCSIVEIYGRLRGGLLIALMMEAVGTSETSINFYEIT
jgi:hypothetical protein